MKCAPLSESMTLHQSHQSSAVWGQQCFGLVTIRLGEILDYLPTQENGRSGGVIEWSAIDLNKQFGMRS